MFADPDQKTTLMEARRMLSRLHEAGFAFWAASGRIVAWTPQATSLLGYAESEALALDVTELLAHGRASTRGDWQATPPTLLTLLSKGHEAVPVQMSLSAVGRDETEGELLVAIAREAGERRPMAQNAQSPTVCALPDVEAQLAAAVRHLQTQNLRVEEIVKQRTLELQERESLFRSIFEHAATGIALADMSGKFLECNDAFQKLIGFKQRELRHLTLNALSHPDDRSLDGSLFREMVDGRREYYETTKRLIRKDGTVLWIQASVSLIKDAEGKPRYCMGLINDITEQRRSAQRSAIQLTLNKILADNPPVNIATIQILQAICKNLDWQIGEFWTQEDAEPLLRRQVSWQAPGFGATEFNQFSQHLTMRIGEGLPGRIWSTGQPDWISDVLRDSNFLRKREAQKAGLKGALGFPIRSAEGLLGIMVFTCRDFREPDRALLGMMVDFGAQIGQYIVRKQAEKDLQFLGSIVKSAGEAIIGTTLGGTITSWNHAAERLFGYASTEALGMPSSFLFPQEIDSELDEALERIQQGEPTTRIETLAVPKTGPAREVWVTPAPIRDDSGRVNGVSLTVFELEDR